MTQIMTMVSQVSDEILKTIQDNPDKVYFPGFSDKGITVDRVMFTVPGTNFEIYWYGFLIALGILLAMIYGFRKFKPVGIDADRATDAIIGGLVGAILGARTYYILFNSEISFKEFFNIRNGGLAIYGGIIGALLVGGIIAKLRKLRVSAILDVAAPGFFIGQAIGRWGNFFNQEAFGSNTDLPWGMMSSSTIEYLSNNGGDGITAYAPVHPCFLYESIWCVIGFILLNAYFKHRKFDGEIFLMYTGWYGLGRFFIEGLRTDSLYIGSIRVSQLLAGICFVASVILIIVFRKKVKQSGNYKFYYETKESIETLAASEEKTLKKAIEKAKAKGKDSSELENKYAEKFGNKDVDNNDKEEN
ncbi:MAG: prolipoprotein diacylglyceryl transferase [Oscillospiraceae bacterium]